MKNVFILIGGNCHSGSPKNKLSEEIETWLSLKNQSQSKLLLVPFAKKPDDWEQTSNKYLMSVFANLIEKKKISYILADPNPSSLKKQLLDADLLFFSGGSELQLMHTITKNMIPKENRIIIGVSAGANFLATEYYSNDRKTVEKGLGLLPVRTLCHASQNNASKAILLSLSKSIPVIPIKEGQFLTLIY